MDKRTRDLERSLRANGYDKDTFDAYMHAMERSGIPLCGCESSDCIGVHFYDSERGPSPLEAHIDYEQTNPGFCMEQVDPKVKVEYVQMCDRCAQQLPEEWHMDDCECTKCGPNIPDIQDTPKSPQDQIAGYLDENGEFVSDEEPDPTEEGWHEDWESDEFEDDEDLDHQRRDY